MARLWDTNMADRAAAIDQALKLGGRIIEPPRPSAGFQSEPGPPSAPGGHLPGSPDEPY